jgi:Zn-dependent peptidase ImmA (M78 family)
MVDMARDGDAGIRELFGGATLDSDVVAAAADVRRRLGITVAAQRQWTDAFRALREWRQAVESIGVLVFRFSDVPSEVARGFSIGELPWPVVALNSKDSAAGRCFTLIHEVGHLCLGGGGTCDLDDERGGAGSLPRRVETFCNRLAANVLMPRDAFLQFDEVQAANQQTLWRAADLQAVARAFSVSRDAALIRLLELGKTNQTAFDATRDELRQIAAAAPATSGFELPPEGAIREVGETFARFVLNAYHGERITARDVSDYLGIQFKHVGKVEDLLETSGADR